MRTCAVPKPARVCAEPGCPQLAEVGGYCRAHARAKRPPDERPSASRRGYDAKWRRNRAKFLKANPYCELCGAPSTDVDHRLARAKGGTDHWDNLQALCHSCHSRKTATQDGGWGRGGCIAA